LLFSEWRTQLQPVVQEAVEVETQEQLLALEVSEEDSAVVAAAEGPGVVVVVEAVAAERRLRRSGCPSPSSVASCATERSVPSRRSISSLFPSRCVFHNIYVPYQLLNFWDDDSLVRVSEN
jgi:hypothetical protein